MDGTRQLESTKVESTVTPSMEFGKVEYEETPTPTSNISMTEIDNVENKRQITTLTSLPIELNLQIASYLTYPDALSLKHVNRWYYGWVYTGVNLKIEWLIERRTLHLDCPHDRKCELGSDTKFCRGSVRLLMQRRREHYECDTQPGGRGCLIYGTNICTFVRKKESRLHQQHGLRARFTLAMCMIREALASFPPLAYETLPSSFVFCSLLGIIGTVLGYLFSLKWKVMTEF